jgi:hypothetical protein
LSTIGGISKAFIFGSFADGTQDSLSDVDIIITGEINEDALIEKISGLRRKVGNHKEIIDQYFNNLKQTGLFKPAGNDIKWIIKNPITDEQKTAIFDTLLQVKKNIEDNGIIRED